MSLQVISEDHYTTEVAYAPATVTLSRDQVGTRYVMAAIRTLVDPNDAADLAAVHVLQDAVTVTQYAPGYFSAPDWDPVSQKTVRDALVTLATTLPDTKDMFGTAAETDPVRHLIGSANAWGGNPERDAFYLTVVPSQNDGTTVHQLTVKDVPVDGFWSVTVYNKDGYFTANEQNAYSLNNITRRQGRRRLDNDPVRRLGCGQRAADHPGLELHRAAVPAAGRDSRRRLDVPGGRARLGHQHHRADGQAGLQVGVCAGGVGQGVALADRHVDGAVGDGL